MEYGTITLEQKLGQERSAIRQARRYIDDHFDQGISLTELADHVALSPYYLLRVFRAEVGMPPYTYLESVRIRRAQRLIEAGKPLAEVAVEAGFSSQSHLTHRFKQIIGVTPDTLAYAICTVFRHFTSHHPIHQATFHTPLPRSRTRLDSL